MIKGVCGPNTREKLEDFRQIMRHHINVVSRINGQWRDPEYLYIDAFAGPGMYDPDGFGNIKGSPVIMQHLLRDIRMPYRLHVIEKDNINFAQLMNKMTNDQVGIVVPHLGDNRGIISQIPIKKNQFGMMFFDPDMSLLQIQSSFDIARSIPDLKNNFIDIMVYISGGFYKRGKQSDKFVHLKDVIKSVPKDYVVIRQLKGAQFTFIVFTNYQKWATWKNRGWFPLESKEGEMIWERLINFKCELKKNLSGTQPQLTGLMQSTSDIPHLELSAHKSSKGLAGYAKDVISAGLRKFTI